MLRQAIVCPVVYCAVAWRVVADNRIVVLGVFAAFKGEDMGRIRGAVLGFQIWVKKPVSETVLWLRLGHARM